MSLIGIGQASKYNIYILLATTSKLFLDLLIGLNPQNPDRPATMFRIFPILNNHLLFQNLLEFLGFLLGALIIYKVSIYFNKYERKNKEISLKELSSVHIRANYIAFFLIALFFSSNLITRTFLYLNFLNLELWMLEIIFLAILSKNILKIEINRHKKAAMFLVIPLLILEIVSCSLPETKHTDEYEDQYLSDYNIYKRIGKKIGYSYIPIIYIALIISTIMRDYSWVKSKYLMDKRLISLSKILLFIGVVGIFLTIIAYIIASCVPCETFHNVEIIGNDFYRNDIFINLEKEICFLVDYDEKGKTLKLYYDKFSILLDDYEVFNKDIKIEIFIILPLYVIINSFKICFQMVMIKYLEPYNILVSDNLYFFLNRLIVFIINKGDEEYLTVGQFFLMELLEVIYIFSNLVYIEIIELKFWRLNYDLKINIFKRGILECDEYFIDDEDKGSGAKEKKKEERPKEENKIELSGGYEYNENDYKNINSLKKINSIKDINNFKNNSN